MTWGSWKYSIWSKWLTIIHKITPWVSLSPSVYTYKLWPGTYVHPSSVCWHYGNGDHLILIFWNQIPNHTSVEKLTNECLIHPLQPMRDFENYRFRTFLSCLSFFNTKFRSKLSANAGERFSQFSLSVIFSQLRRAGRRGGAVLKILLGNVHTVSKNMVKNSRF